MLSFTAIRPTVVTGTASSITASSGIVAGTVNPQGCMGAGMLIFGDQFDKPEQLR